jgi:outer membrane protein assembly factor BamA
MSQQALRLWIVLALLVTAVYSAGAQTRAMVSRIDFVGLRHISNDAMRQRIFTRPGDPYNNEVLRLSLCRRAAAPSPEASNDSRAERQPQPRSNKSV